MFCEMCGAPREFGASFCGQCGSRFLQGPSESHVTASAPQSTFQPQTWAVCPPQYRSALRQGEMFRFVLDDVEIRMKFVISHRYESQPPPTFRIPHLLVTDGRIVFLDKSNPPRLYSQKVWFKRVPAGYKYRENEKGKLVKIREITPVYGISHRFADSIDFGPFWVLKRFLNEELHREFLSNPKAFSKAPIAAWWIHGMRDWSWVQSLDQEDRDLRFGLVRIQAVSTWQTGAKPTPANHWEGTAKLSLKTAEDARRLKERIEESIRPELGFPFTHDYIANLPTKPPSKGVIAYYYVFWTALPAAILLGILLGMGAPLYVAVPIMAAFCFVVVRFLRSALGWLAKRFGSS
jgi:hypothetical protein